MRNLLICLLFVLLSIHSFAVTLTKEWIVPDYVQPSNYGLNSMAYDPVSTRLVNPNYGSDLSLEIYDSTDGSFVKSSKLSGSSFGYLAGFGIGISQAGGVYMSDSDKLYKLDDISDTSVTEIQGTAAFEYPCRNISIKGTGINTYMASTGSTDNGPIQIWRPDDEACSSFSPWKTLVGISQNPVGAGKSGCALSPVSGNDPPEWVAGGEVFGEQYLRLFRYNSFNDTYEHAFTVGGKTGDIFPCFDVAFDFTEGYKPILATLTTSGHADPNLPVENGFNTEAMVEIFELNPDTGRLTSKATYDFTGELNKIGNRGSIEIDTVNKKIYIGYRCDGGTNHLAMACLSYTLDSIEPTPTTTATPTPSMTPTITPTPTPPPTPTPEILIVDGYEKPTKGLRFREAFVSQSHGYTWNDEAQRWGWQRPVIEGTVEDLITPMFCNRWFLHYFENAGAMTVTVRERDENTTEIITNFDHYEDPEISSGVWMNYSGQGSFNGSCIMTNTVTGNEPSASVIFSMDIPESGWYCLYIRHPEHLTSSRSVPYIVTDGSGYRHEFVINQTQKPGRWYYLSRFYFEAGEDVPVLEINNSTGETGRTVLADAVRIGGGMGTYDGGGGVSGLPRWKEFAKAWIKYVGAPEHVWNHTTTYHDFYPRIYYRDWESPGKLCFRIHSNAVEGATASGSYAITYADDEELEENRYAAYIKMWGAVQSYWDPSWLRRTPKRYTDSSWSPMILIELAFHDNVERDLVYLMDPDFRHIIARGLYTGSVDYYTDNTGMYLPEAPSSPYVLSRGSGRVKIGWEPPLFGEDPTNYRIYYSRHPHCFNEYVNVSSSEHEMEIELDENTLFYFQLRAENDGGISFPTETLCAISPTTHSATCLIVNGFDRLDWKVQEIDNTRNFVIQHSDAIKGAMRNLGQIFAISSTSNEAVARSLVDAGEFSMIDWICGEESIRYEITHGKGFTDDRVFTPGEQNKINDYLENGGKIFLSGSDIAWDLETNGETSGTQFLSDTLHCSLVEDDAESYSIEGSAGKFAGLNFNLDDGSHEIYDADQPDEISPQGGAEPVLHFAGTSKISGIVYPGTDSNLVMFSFPFEAVMGEETRAALMNEVIQTLFPEYSIMDADRIARYILGKIDLKPAEKKSADINGDGCINAADIIMLMP